MTEKEMKALVSLLDDSDEEVSHHVEERIKNIGESIIPILEQHWEENSFDNSLQAKIEELIHELQMSNFERSLLQWKESGAEDLLLGMFHIARYQYPDLEFRTIKSEVNQLYFEAWLLLRDEVHPQDIIKALNHVFFEKYKYSGNTKNFHSPANSLINQVLETKRGNPISLCVIYMIVAQRLGYPVFGVNLPTLFILTYQSSQVQFYINVFNKGLIFSKSDIDAYLKQMNIEAREDFYSPCDNLQIIKRVLLNLMVSFQKNSEIAKVSELKKVYEQL